MEFKQFLEDINKTLVVYHRTADPDLTIQKIQNSNTSPRAWGQALYASPNPKIDVGNIQGHVYAITMQGNFLSGQAQVQRTTIDSLLNLLGSEFAEILQEVLEGNASYEPAFQADDLYDATGGDILFAVKALVGVDKIRRVFLTIGIDGVINAHTHWGSETVIYNYNSIKSVQPINKE